MTRPRQQQQPLAPSGSIRADEVLSLGELQQRFKWGYKSSRHAQSMGLPTVELGRQKFCLGEDVIQFFRKLADAQAGGNSESKGIDDGL